MKRLIALLAIALLFVTCSLFEPYDEIYYHMVGVEGYAHYQDEPVADLIISIWSHFKSQSWFTKPPINEEFRTDTNGYFYAKFIRRTGHEDAKSYNMYIYNDSLQYEVLISPADFHNARKNIQLGKLNLVKKNF